MTAIHRDRQTDETNLNRNLRDPETRAVIRSAREMDEAAQRLADRYPIPSAAGDVDADDTIIAAQKAREILAVSGTREIGKAAVTDVPVEYDRLSEAGQRLVDRAAGHIGTDDPTKLLADHEPPEQGRLDLNQSTRLTIAEAQENAHRYRHDAHFRSGQHERRH